MLSHSLIGKHSRLVCCNCSPLFFSPLLPHSLSWLFCCLWWYVFENETKNWGRNQALSLFSICSLCRFFSLSCFSSLSSATPCFRHVAHCSLCLHTHVQHARTHTQRHTLAHGETLSHLCNCARKKSSTAPSLRNQQLWDNSVTNKVNGVGGCSPLMAQAEKIFYYFFSLFCVCGICDVRFYGAGSLPCC